MACTCCQAECSSCNPCVTNPCNPCTPTVPPLICQDECELPVYTNEGCIPQNSSCVNYNGVVDPCIPITEGMPFNTILQNVFTYVKNTTDRITAGDDSITITPTDDSCDDKATVKVNISAEEDNVIQLNEDGLYVPAAEAAVETPISTFNVEKTIILSASGTLNHTLTADIVLADNADNILEILPNGEGLYAPAPDAPLLTSVEDTNTVELTVATDTLTADVIVDPKSTNIITSTNGLLAQYEFIQDLEDNLTQHFTFEVPPIRDLTYLVTQPHPDPPLSVSALNIQLAAGTNYATDFSQNNPNVKVFWDDTDEIVNTLATSTVGPNYFLSHTYPGLSDFPRNGFVKGYNGDHLTHLVSGFGTQLSGFKFIKGAEHILTISLSGHATGTSGVYDFKGMYNATNVGVGSVSSSTYKGARPYTTLANLNDLLSITSLGLSGAFANTQDVVISAASLKSVTILGCQWLNLVSFKNKTAFSFFADASAIDTLDLQGTQLVSFALNNTGAYYSGYINKLILPLTTNFTDGEGAAQGTGLFNFTGTSTINILQINGVHEDTYGSIIPTKILFRDFATDGKFRYIDANQDFIKDEAVISVNNNGIIQGNMQLGGNSQVHSFGFNYLNNYYNPIYDPLNGWNARWGVTIAGGAVTGVSVGGIGQELDSGGHRFNSIPTFVLAAGPGTGFNPTIVMQLGSSNSIPGGIIAGGTGYTVNDTLTMGVAGGDVLIPAVITVKAVGGSGEVTAFEIISSVHLGEYINTLPPTLTHTSGGTGSGFILDTTHRWNVRRAYITGGNGGTGYTSASRFKLEVSTFNGTGTGTASVAAKAAIDSLHNKSWQLRW